MATKPKEHPALTAVRRSGSGKVKIAVSDIDGVLRGKYLHRDKFFGAVEGGFAFCDVVFGWDSGDVCYDNARLTGWQHGFPDATARIALETHRNVPWDGGVPFFLGEFVTGDGSPSPICPRQPEKPSASRASSTPPSRSARSWIWPRGLSSPSCAEARPPARSTAKRTSATDSHRQLECITLGIRILGSSCGLHFAGDSA